jgi:DNA-binding beta-propeller fold protein YncE
MGSDGRFVYLGGVDYPYLEVASTATNTVVRKIGPLNGPGVRPFTINGSQTLAFTTARSFLGFQVSSIKTGKVLYSVSPPGFTFDPATFGRTPDHGISLSPDGRQLYLIDTPNGYVHVFDVSGLPAVRPRDVANIKLLHPPPNDGWLQHSRDGRYVYVGRAGDVIDTKTRKIVAFLPSLQQTADFLEIDWRNGHPVSATSRYGTSYGHGSR